MTSFGKVTGRLMTVLVDQADPDTMPEIVPLTGKVTFTLNVPRVVEAGATPAPAVYGTLPLVAVLDADGYLSTPTVGTDTANYQGLWVLANDDDDLNPDETMYSVSYDVRLPGEIGTVIPLPTHNIYVPAGETVDLATFIPPSGAPAIGTAQAEALLALAVRTINGVGPDSEGNVDVAGGGGGGGTWGSITGTLSAQTDLNAVLVALQADVNSRASDTVVVKLTGAQTIAGIKTFSSAPVVPDGSFAQSKVASLTTDLALLAPKASPALTGTPTAPTPTGSDDSTKVATTAFVKAAISALVAGSPGLLDTLDELAAALGDDPNFATTITGLLALKAPLASPVFTGNPQAPTPATSDNDTSVATTAMVQAAATAKVLEKMEVVGAAAYAAGPKTAGKLWVVQGA
jgi:hypothetical protein